MDGRGGAARSAQSPTKRRRTEADEPLPASKSNKGDQQKVLSPPRGGTGTIRSPKQPSNKRQRTEEREPSPISDSSDDDRPKVQKRPGRGAAITQSQRAEAEKLRQERIEQEKREAANRVTKNAEAVAEHYNNVQQRGREWRTTQSEIKGLRSLNNWIKSTLIQKFSRPEVPVQHLTVLDLACGKGGDLGKWEKAPQVPSLYVGCDIAQVSIEQAKERYHESLRRRGRFRRGPQMEAQFYVQDTFKPSLGQIPIIRQVGFNPNAAPGGIIMPGMPTGGFDVVSIMFALHYSFESEELAQGFLKNVAGALKKGGRFIGVMPNSDVITAKIKELLADESTSQPAANGATEDEEDDWDPEKPVSNGAIKADDEDEWDPEKPADSGDNEDEWDPEKPSDEAAPKPIPEQSGPPLEFGNKLYSVKIPRWQASLQKALPADGIFRPPFGWKYDYHLVEAVEVPEYVVPWEALRAMAEDYGLELLYRKPFANVLEDESEDRELGILAERMGVKSRDRTVGGGTGLMVTPEEMEAASFYHAFCFYKT